MDKGHFCGELRWINWFFNQISTLHVDGTLQSSQQNLSKAVVAPTTVKAVPKAEETDTIKQKKEVQNSEDYETFEEVLVEG